MKRKTKLVFGVAVNDADFPVKPKVNGKQVTEPSYMRWMSMLARCYATYRHTVHKTYAACSVSPEWLYYSNFHKWYETQYKEPGWEIDKDLLYPGNKVYGPEKCIFVPKSVNQFTNGNLGKGGGEMIGAFLNKKSGKYTASCSNPFTGKLEHLGQFATEIEAHLAWKSRKRELACQIADTVHDERLAKALRERYL